jgi:hypothetical protein
MSTLYTHYSLEITAAGPYWHALGFQPIDPVDPAEKGTVAYHRVGSIDGILILGIAKTGAHDERALIWALEEVHRRSEENGRTAAIAQEARAIDKLAESIRQVTDEQLLARLFGKVSEKTAYAIKAQLRQNPL